MSLRIYTILICLFLYSCSSEPEPLNYGTDLCYTCKMTLMDRRFGAELVTKKGKIYKFDDMRCFLNYYNSGIESTDQYKHLLVTDYANTSNLIDATNAFYVSSPEIRSPMDGGVAAFHSKATMDSFNKQWKGIYLTWGEVVTKYK